MKQTLAIALAVLLLAACRTDEKQLKQRAAELCQYIPSYEKLKEAKGYLTDDFYAVLDTLYFLTPDEQPVAHEWRFFFVTGNGGTIDDCTVTAVEQTDRNHAVATISARQRWPEEYYCDASDSDAEDSFDSDTDVEEHHLYMERVDGQWLMSDFDSHKADCRRHLAIYREEQALRRAMGHYLVDEIGRHYRQGDFCVPTIIIVSSGCDVNDTNTMRVWGDFWVDWYRQVGDTLKCVAGGNHSGCITLVQKDGIFQVTDFEQTLDGAGYDASARRIFDDIYSIYMNIHGNQELRDGCRCLQLLNYIDRHGISATYYQDYGWPAVRISDRLREFYAKY